MGKDRPKAGDGAFDAPPALTEWKMRVLTIANLCLWVVLFLAWIPYTAMVGFADPISVEVRWILVVTAALMALLAALRIRRQRPVLG